MSQESSVTLHKSLVHSHVEYANSVWSPHYQEFIKRTEKVQIRDTKLLPQIKGHSYQE